MNIAILGAPGCVGRHLIKKLLESSQYEVIASYRKKQDAESMQHDHLEWRQVDLKDLPSTENFLHGADVLIYLIHSLGTKDFEKLDVQLANVAGQAAQNIRIRKIIYLGGIMSPQYLFKKSSLLILCPEHRPETSILSHPTVS